MCVCVCVCVCVCARACVCACVRVNFMSSRRLCLTVLSVLEGHYTDLREEQGSD